MKYKYVMVGVLALSTFANYLILFNLGVLLPAITADLSLSPSDQGWLGSSAVVANLLLSIPFGWLLSRFNAKRVTTASLMLGALFLFMQGWAPVFLVLLVGRLLFGLSAVAREPARAMLTHQWIPDREIVLVNGILVGVIGVAIAVGLLLTPLILSSSGDDWRLAFYIFAVVTLFVTIIWHFLGKEKIIAESLVNYVPHNINPLKSLLRYREIWMMGLGLFGANILWFAFLTFWPTLLVDRYGISLMTSGALMAISGIVSSVFALIIAFVVTRKDISRTWLVVCGVLITITSIGMVMTDSLGWQYSIAFTNGIGWSFFPITMTLPFKLPGIKPREIAVAVGFLEMCVWAGGVVGPAISGVLFEITGDLRMTLIYVSLFGLLLCAAGGVQTSFKRQSVIIR